MKFMAGKKISTIQFEYTLENRRMLFIQFFSLGVNSTQSFDDKLELIHLLSFLTYSLQKRDPEKYKSSYDVLLKVLNYDPFEDGSENGYVAFLESLSIICDDLLNGVEIISKPEKYHSGSEVADRINNLISQWLPF